LKKYIESTAIKGVTSTS